MDNFSLRFGLDILNGYVSMVGYFYWMVGYIYIFINLWMVIMNGVYHLLWMVPMLDMHNAKIFALITFDLILHSWYQIVLGNRYG